MNHALSAGDLCTRFVVIAHRDLSLHDAARRMRIQPVGCLVIDDDIIDLIGEEVGLLRHPGRGTRSSGGTG